MIRKQKQGKKGSPKSQAARNPGPDQASVPVRGVEPRSPVEPAVPELEAAQVPSGGARNPIGKLVSGVQMLGDHAVGAARHGVSDLVHNQFGLRAVVNFAGNGVHRTASFLNISDKAACAVLIASILGGGGGAFFVWQGELANEHLVRQEQLLEDDCSEEIDGMRTEGALSGGGGDMEEYAAKAWAVGKLIGMTDEQCAGMLGNMQKESGMDPTTIEAIYDEPFNINGPRKRAAAADLCSYTTTGMRQAYVNSGWGINGHTTRNGCTMAPAGGSPNILSAAYEGNDGHFYPGIGLFGFTGPITGDLVAYAEAAGKDWWDFDLQMAFSIDTTGGYSRASWVETWINSGPYPGSPADAATQWNINFEGNASNFAGDRAGQYAQEWFARFAGTNGDTAYAQSILALANSVAGGQASAHVMEKIDDCATAEQQFDNLDLARAAVAYAYETIDQGRGNNGTQLYQAVHDAVFPGDPWYQSCDRGVTTAVRWSGSDDNITAGYTDSLDVYFQGCSEHWQDMGEFGSAVQYEDLQPGDILNTTSARRGTTHGHIVIFVGNDIVREKFPNSAADFVSASFEERSPGCETWTPGKFISEGYHVYRNIAPEANPRYTSVVEGQNLSDR